MLPLPENVKTPVAEPQLAEVISNEDPEGKGRVQVTFPWMAGTTAQSPFMRVMTPDAGSSSNHSKNRGQVFIPEVGDQVMVGFEQNDPSKPFVMGSMYHGQNHSGGGQDNNIKSIITKSGHEIVFNDTPNGESITIKDRNDNHFIIDTANNDITITANETLTLNSKNMNINVSQNMNTNIGMNKATNVGVNYTTSTGVNYFQTVMGNSNMLVNGIATEKIMGDFVSEVEKERKEMSKGETNVNAKGEMIKHSEKTMRSNSKDKTNLF